MSITLKIDNPNQFEEQLLTFVKHQKEGLQEITVDVLNNFLNSFQKNENFSFQKKDPKKHSRMIQRTYDSNDVDEVALLHIEDSAKYVHDLRREKR